MKTQKLKKNKIRRIGLVFAMRGEAKPLVDRLKLKPAKPLDPNLPMLLYRGKVGTISVALSINGIDSRHSVDQVGTIAASLSTYLLIKHFKPDVLINPGTAGGFRSQGTVVGDVFIGQGNVQFHDRSIPVKKYLEYASGNYPTLQAGRLLRELGLKPAIISTSNSVASLDAKLEKLSHSTSPVALEMEAAAIGWVAWEKKIPLLPIKGITDLVDAETPMNDQFVSNFRKVTDSVAENVAKLLKWMEGKSLDEMA